jgi:tRNA dimethylallyltransferase
VDKPPVACILGPTASGKTGLAVELVEPLRAEIVSVDSAMVYRGLDIGTAKPDAATLQRAPHALIDIRDPGQAYSAAEFVRDARTEIERIHAAGRLPLLVGGTSLYFRALEYGLADMPGRNAAVRARLTAQAQKRGWADLHARLARLDPVTAARIHPNDAQRIQRMLEIYELTGEVPSTLHARGPANQRPWRIARLVVAPGSRAELHKKIEQRFHLMMAQGFLAEVEKLHGRPDLDLTKSAMRAVGYRQLWQALDGEFGLPEAVDRAIIASRQLAKRQLTWLRSLEGAEWLASDEADVAGRARWLLESSFSYS